jgi:hypothetical protein
MTPKNLSIGAPPAYQIISNTIARTREQRDALVALRTWQCAVSPVPRSFFYTPPRFPFQLSARVDLKKKNMKKKKTRKKN